MEKTPEELLSEIKEAIEQEQAEKKAEKAEIEYNQKDIIEQLNDLKGGDQGEK